MPNGSPTRWATTSAWCTAASTAPNRAGTATTMKSMPTGSTSAAADERQRERRDDGGPRACERIVASAPAIARRRGGQCSAEASVRPNSAIGASKGWASSVMQKKVPRMVPFGVAMRVQLVYSKRLAGLEDRLVADDGQAAHFVDVAVARR